MADRFRPDASRDSRRRGAQANAHPRTGNRDCDVRTAHGNGNIRSTYDDVGAAHGDRNSRTTYCNGDVRVCHIAHRVRDIYTAYCNGDVCTAYGDRNFCTAHRDRNV